MRLNPQKCIFGVVKGKFLGHIISWREIEANPKKIWAILDMERPTLRNQVQSLAGKIVALARFVSRLTDKCAPFFRLLRDQRCKEIVWGPKQEEAFKQIKAYLMSAPVLSKPILGEMLYLYITASQTIVSSVLIRKESDIEHAVFYAGEGFTPVESRYPDVEKLALTLIVTARRLRHYFQAHSITLYTNHHLRQIMQKPEINGRLVKWAIELGEFDIHYRPRVAIKGQVAAYFIFELTPMKVVGESVELTPVQVVGESSEAVVPERARRCISGSRRHNSGSFLLTTQVEVFSDSQLVVNQVNGSFEAKEPQLNSYQALSKAFMQRFNSASLSHIPHKENSNADALARLATGGPGKGRKKARIEVFGKPSISKTISKIFMVEAGAGEPMWMDPIIEFMKKGRLQFLKLQVRDRGVRRSDHGRNPRRVCGNHSGSRSLAHKAFRTGFFWPNMGAMPFTQWGLDLIGILPTAPGQFKYMIVAVDYYMKWVEVEPLGKITTECVKNFLMKNIYCKFEVPKTIVTDNGTQFNNNHLIEFTKGMGTKMVFASMAHPQTNGQVEAVNKIIKKLLKKKLEDAKGLWAQKLSEVLWAIRTTTTEAKGETLFSMAFGTEAVLPIETLISSGRVENFDATTNKEGLQLNIDLIEERRERADLHNQVYKQQVARHYNNKVRARMLGLGDWVMKKIMTKTVALDPTWEGPYEIIEEVGPSTFFLRDQDGIVTGHPWNTEHLRFYPV
ncbi:PREDICTED: uncharacterized protein LOC101300632 [Fragaria vesca subsp. vesca]|uniref:uncharacterized protein LOC101300632 n=1 Tax=Fragaria vesca subsp. vesca TaxID=101020 RepID=UPI0002C363C2|nr:PREDICTED: uncharacterized protein LOC101300632 [Fragaria vesca subsp. vesca]